MAESLLVFYAYFSVLLMSASYFLYDLVKEAQQCINVAGDHAD